MNNSTNDHPEIPNLILEHGKKYNIYPNKSLGQNFILDINFCAKLIKHEKIENATVIEIGPGLGSMTRAILNRNPKKLICIEKDRRCINVLKDLQIKYHQLEYLEDDAMECMEKVIAGLQNVIIISNLPYNVGTRIVINILELELRYQNIQSMTFMLQKEVVERMISKHNTKIYGKLSILIQSVCDAKLLHNVSAKNFYPSPDVSSAIVHLIPKIELKLENHKLLFAKQDMFDLSLKMDSSNQGILNLHNQVENCIAEDYKAKNYQSQSQELDNHEVKKLLSSKSNISDKTIIYFDNKLFNLLKEILFLAFSQRRKIIKTSLAKYLKYIPSFMHHLRPEQLEYKEFLNIIINIQNLKTNI